MRGGDLLRGREGQKVETEGEIDVEKATDECK
jgi:hypothetical protein